MHDKYPPEKKKLKMYEVFDVNKKKKHIDILIITPDVDNYDTLWIQQQGMPKFCLHLLVFRCYSSLFQPEKGTK